MAEEFKKQFEELDPNQWFCQADDGNMPGRLAELDSTK
jgi:hypothetical protein